MAHEVAIEKSIIYISFSIISDCVIVYKNKTENRSIYIHNCLNFFIQIDCGNLPAPGRKPF